MRGNVQSQCFHAFLRGSFKTVMHSYSVTSGAFGPRRASDCMSQVEVRNDFVLGVEDLKADLEEGQTATTNALKQQHIRPHNHSRSLQETVERPCQKCTTNSSHWNDGVGGSASDRRCRFRTAYAVSSASLCLVEHTDLAPAGCSRVRFDGRSHIGQRLVECVCKKNSPILN